MQFGLSRRFAPQVLFALCASFTYASLARGEDLSDKIVATGQEGAKQTEIIDPTSLIPKAILPSSLLPGLVKDEAKPAGEATPEVAMGGDGTRTRFLIGLDKAAEFQVFALTNPNRVIVDVAETALRLPSDPGDQPVGLVSSIRAGRSAPGKSRVVIEVTGPVVVESSKIETAKEGSGHFIALEIVSCAATEAQTKTAKKPFKTAPFALGGAGIVPVQTASLAVQPPLPLPAVRPDIRAAKAFKPIIVIDPGHGGDDTGAMKNGAVEKDVVLAFSKVLKAKIEATGRYKVHLTRDTDKFIELGERVKIADRHNANLFIAVHADYAGANSAARGATIYSLRDSTAKSLRKSAKGDVSESVLSKEEAETVKKASVDGDLTTVRSILSDLAGRELEITQERTGIFSKSVVDLMSASTHMRSDPAQQAGFRVLKTANFPSVLIELAYVTNKEDAELLQSDAWRDKVTDSISTAVDNYFGNQLARLPM